jgi:hypothetical protein
MSEDFHGKASRSAAELRPILKSIHNASNPQEPGPYTDGLPTCERKRLIAAAQRSAAETRWGIAACGGPQYLAADSGELLMRHAEFTGGFIGLLLGLNVGLAVPIMTGTFWLFITSGGTTGRAPTAIASRTAATVPETACTARIRLRVLRTNSTRTTR